MSKSDQHTRRNQHHSLRISHGLSSPTPFSFFATISCITQHRRIPSSLSASPPTLPSTIPATPPSCKEQVPALALHYFNLSVKVLFRELEMARLVQPRCQDERGKYVLGKAAIGVYFPRGIYAVPRRVENRIEMSPSEICRHMAQLVVGQHGVGGGEVMICSTPHR
jgi:hypothetical protein